MLLLIFPRGLGVGESKVDGGDWLIFEFDLAISLAPHAL